MELGRRWTVISASLAAPAATWYDEMHGHFVALEESNSIHDNAETSDEMGQVVLYRTLDLKDSAIADTLTASEPFLIRLPLALANRTDSSSSRISRRVPLLAKFSLDQRFMALQMSETLLRIVPTGHEEAECRRHWTIDFAVDANPVPTAPQAVPRTRITPDMLFGRNSAKILPGGVIWSDHGGNSQDLVVVTNRALFCYKVSLIRQKISITHTFPHPSAEAVWWEAQSRTILVGSRRETPHRRTTTSGKKATFMSIKTFFLRFPPDVNTKTTRSFPRLELPPPIQLEPFSVGLLRMESNELETAALPSVSINSLALVNLYGEPYCVELGCMGEGSGIQFYHLARKDRVVCIKTCMPDSFDFTKLKLTFVSVLDNVLCISSLGSQKSLFVDLKDFEGGDDKANEYRGTVVSLNDDQADDAVFHKRLSFLSPGYLVSTQGRGTIYALELNLSRLASAMESSRCSIPFLARRSDREEARKIVLQRFNLMVSAANEHDIDTRCEWMNAFAETYASTPAIRDWDVRASLPLMFKCALLPGGSELQFSYSSALLESYDRLSLAGDPCPSVLSQSSFVENVFLPQAKTALQQDDEAKLLLLTDMTLEVFAALVKKRMDPCPALECLLVAMLWRCGSGQEVRAMLHARAFERRMRANSHFTERSSSTQLAHVALADMIAAIVTEVPLGCLTGHAPTSQIEGERNLVEEILESLSSIASPTVKARHLLRRGRILDAMHLCALNRHKAGRPMAVPSGLRGEDFVCAALETHLSLSPSDRHRVFVFLYAFLRMWDPTSLHFVKSSIRRRHRRNHSMQVGSRSPLEGTRVQRRRSEPNLATLDLETDATFPTKTTGGFPWLGSQDVLVDLFGYQV